MDYSVLLAIEHQDNEHTPKQIRKIMNDKAEVQALLSSVGDTQIKKSMSHYFKAKPNAKWKNSRRRHKFYSSCGRFIYHVSIIDYLTNFNFNKQVESQYKILRKTLQRQDAKGISAVHPTPYQARFVDFMSKEVFVNDGFQDQFYQGEKAKSSATAQLRDEFMNMLND
jgi:hypothetical protein